MRFYSVTKIGIVFCGLLVAPFLVKCTTAPKSLTPQELADLKKLYIKPAAIPYPAENQPTPEKELLGKVLFFEPRLNHKMQSCFTCHQPQFAWSWGNGLERKIESRNPPRHSPSLVNVAWELDMNADGKTVGLEAQAKNRVKRDSGGGNEEKYKAVMKQIAASQKYKALFANAFPGEEVSADTIGRALSTFERTIVSWDSPFDHWIAGDESAISVEAARGFQLFNGKARCVTCHSGWNFSDGSYHDIGIPGNDLGRGAILPNVKAMQHAFKTRALRDISLHAPYMHDESEKTLADVIELYDQGGRVKRETLSPEIRPLRLTQQEKADLIAFLQSLTTQHQAFQIPEVPK